MGHKTAITHIAILKTKLCFENKTLKVSASLKVNIYIFLEYITFKQINKSKSEYFEMWKTCTILMQCPSVKFYWTMSTFINLNSVSECFRAKMTGISGTNLV